MRIARRDIRKIQDTEEMVAVLRKAVANNWSGEWYKQRLYGGWTRPQDGKIMPGHKRSRMFHLADRARFCPKDIGHGERCWTHLGFTNDDPTQSWTCPRCRMKSHTFGQNAAIGYKTMFLAGGNRCLGGETRVWDEGRAEWRRIDEIVEAGEPITVRAWDGKTCVPAYAEPHPPKGPDQLYRVKLQNGREFSATARHRVMLGDGEWAEVGGLIPGDRLKVEWVETFGVRDGDVVSVTEDRVDVHYDLCVPGYENYVAEGVPQHNSWKTLNVVNKLGAWIRGYQPWDGMLTAPKGSGRQWGFAGGSFATAFTQVIVPYIQRVLGDFIESQETQNRRIVCWKFINGDMLFPMSYSQWERAGSSEGSTNPYEGSAWYGFAWDEPMPPGAYVAVSRGLTSGRQQGWGRELISATPIYSPFLFTLHQQAASNGGPRKEVWTDVFSIHENTMMTPAEVQEFLATLPPQELEAREFGRFMSLAGKVYDVFENAVHIVQDDNWDPLVDPDDPDRPSNWPIVHVVDPHDSRPWAMGWYAIGPQQERVVVREWPEQPWEKIRGRERYGYQDYARIIENVEKTIPGGRERVLRRVMDPNKGRTPTTGDRGRTIAQSMKLPENGGYVFDTRVNDDLTAGHHAVHQAMWYDKTKDLSALNAPHFYCLLSCRNHHWSINNYTRPEEQDWDRLEKKQPDGPAKDFCDLIRYVVMDDFQYRPWQEGSRMSIAEYNLRLDRERATSRY